MTAVQLPEAPLASTHRLSVSIGQAACFTAAGTCRLLATGDPGAL